MKMTYATALYSLTLLVTKGMSILLMPLILSRVPPEEFGRYTLMITAATLGSTLISGGVRQLYAVLSLTAPNHHALVTTLIATSSLWGIGVSGVSISLAWLLGYPLHMTILVIIMAYVIHLIEWYHQIAAYTSHTLRIALLSITQNTLALLFMYQYTRSAPTAYTLLYAQCISIVPYLIALTCHALTRIPHPFLPNTQHAKQATEFMPGVVATWCTTQSTRWLLAQHDSLVAVGWYGLIDMLHTLWRTGWVLPFQHIHLPHLLKKITCDRSTIKTHLSSLGSIMLFLLCLLCIGWPLIGKPVAHYILPPAYAPAIPLIPIACIGNIWYWGAMICASIAQAQGSHRKVSLYIMMQSAFHFGITYGAIHSYGLMGAIGSWTISQGMLGIMMYSCIHTKK